MLQLSIRLTVTLTWLLKNDEKKEGQDEDGGRFEPSAKRPRQMLTIVSIISFR